MPRKADIRGRLRVYVVTDPTAGGKVLRVAEEALRGGATAIQLRDKGASTERLLETGRALGKIARERGALFIINDRPDIALAVDADGVHVGQEDVPVRIAREVVGPDRIVGASAGTVEEARDAEAQGADYIGAGSVFHTSTKADAGAPIGLRGLSRICRAVRIPVVGIGGIGQADARSVLEAGAAGVAVVSAVASAPDAEEAARRLYYCTGGPPVRVLGEFALIERLRKIMAEHRHESVLVGAGDDAACLQTNGGKVLAACDMLVEGIHFDVRYATARDIGWKALAVNISDIAAMGGVPRHALVSLGLTGNEPVGFIEDLYRGMIEVGERFGVCLVGGDTVRSPDALTISASLLGSVPDSLAVRGGARPGDVIAVTGSPGRSALGLMLLRDVSLEEKALSEGIPIEVLESFYSAHLRPLPRVREGRLLGSIPGIGGLIDISDGLSNEVNHIARESGAGAVVYEGSLPVDEDLSRTCEALGIDAISLVLRGGEDFELLFTVREEEADEALRALKETGTKARAIGRVVPGPGVFLVSRETGDSRPLGSSSYEHFVERRGNPR